jgi:ectoine hydroxylase-related dioxygenase (phytanoyl-CoA dioxygenase family)
MSGSWHKDDNAPYNARKQRHHQAIQLELLYYPQDVDETMGPTATIPFSHYWTKNHETDHDSFATDHLDFNYQIEGMEGIDVSGPGSQYSREGIESQTTEHDFRMAAAVTETGWPVCRQFLAAPLKAGSVIICRSATVRYRPQLQPVVPSSTCPCTDSVYSFVLQTHTIYFTEATTGSTIQIRGNRNHASCGDFGW